MFYFWILGFCELIDSGSTRLSDLWCDCILLSLLIIIDILFGIAMYFILSCRYAVCVYL